jgi:hypothetical protein
VKDHLSSTETGVFRDTIDKTIKGLHDNINRWAVDLRLTLPTNQQEAPEDDTDEQQSVVVKITLEDVFADVEDVFHRTYLEKDREETQEKVEAKRVLRQIIDTAELAFPILTREMEKCKN